MRGRVLDHEDDILGSLLGRRSTVHTKLTLYQGVCSSFPGVSNLFNDGRHLPQVRRALTCRRRIAVLTKELIGKVLVRVG
jgi:hypothetical protein